MMEIELEPRAKPLPFKVKAMSRESPSQKATNVLDSDLRTHWSTGTNTKEWILLELDEPCLLSHIRIYNKSVLEWEISVGLRYKPETFVKVRPRCEAPRRDMLYPMNYITCRYVRVACLRGNPIAIFFIQLIGVSVAGLEPEFQPVVNYLLPHIISHKQDAHDLHLQLLQDISNRLLVFLPQLENDLNSFPDAADSKIRFFAMLVGPFYPILHLVNERASNSTVDSDPLRNRSSSTLAISSNFEVQPRRSRSPLPFNQIPCSSIAFRPEAVFVLLRKAFENSHLGTVCRAASRALQILLEPITSNEDTIQNGDSSTLCKDDCFKSEATCRFTLNDYSGLFGDEFKICYDHPDDSCMNLLDISVVEEAIFHALYASASEPTVCCMLAENAEGFWSLLALIQALLPALRPSIILTEQVDETFYQWKTPLVHRALAQITSVSSSTVSCSLLRASAGYLLSFQRSQVRAACVLIDLHFGPLAPWTSTLVVKVDLAIELLEDLLDAFQLASRSTSRARAALKYVILGLSGHMDDVLLKYKEVKHKVLFLVEMLEPFLDPVISASKPTIAFGDVAISVPGKQEQTCAIALNVICTAVQRAAVLPSLESEWRRGTVAPSVLLSVLGPHMTLPDEIDFCKCTVKNTADEDVLPARLVSSARNHGLSDGFDAKSDLEALSKTEGCEDAKFLFAAMELKNMDLTTCSFPEGFDVSKKTTGAVKSNSLEKQNMNKFSVEPFQSSAFIMAASSSECLKFHADYLQLINLDDAERRASEFQRLALDLHLQVDATPEGHSAAIDALLLAAECYTNPFFMISFRSNRNLLDQLVTFESNVYQKKDMAQMMRNYKKDMNDLDSLFHSETRRDTIVLEILLKAAKWEFEHLKSSSKESPHETENFGHGFELSVEDTESADAVTLLRQNQALLCHFLKQRLLSSQQILHEVLFQAMCFYLRTATELFCSPDDVVKIIIQYAEHLNKLITSFYGEVNDHNDKLEREKLYSIQRHWSVLQKLVMASSRSDIGLNCGNIVNVSHYGSLVPLVSWIQEISAFSHSHFPLARYVGWMAISQFAKQYINEQIFLTLDVSSLTNLLSIFLDELVLVDDTVNQNVEAPWLEKSNKQHPDRCKLSDDWHGQGSVNIPYPDLYVSLPDLKLQFRTFGELILEAVALQLKAIPAIAISDVLCWFSGFCLAPFSWKDRFSDYIADSDQHLRGNAGRNAKAVILYLLESIVSAHMEAMVPEMPRVAQILMSLCKAPYCDVDFLDSCLHLLNPLISYALTKASDAERLLGDHMTYHDFETLCFEDIFDYIGGKVGGRDGSSQQIYQGPLIVFLLGSVFCYLSLPRKKDILQYVTSLADFKLSAPSSYLDYLKAFQNIVDSCLMLLVQSLELYTVLVPDELQLKVVSGPEDSPESVINTSGSSRFLSMKKIRLSCKDMDEISIFLEELISKLHPAVEFCWRLHSQLSHKITLASGKCYLLMRCMASLSCIDDKIRDETNADERGTVASDCWKNAVEDLNVKILALQNNNCWQIACAMHDFLLGLPEVFPLDHIISGICSTIKGFCCCAPRISWRLQSDKWLSVIFNRIRPLQLGESSLVDLFCTMLGHTEPEQRAVALRHLGGLVGLDINNGVLKLTYGSYQDNASAGSVLQTIEKTIFNLVSRTWDKVATLTSSDPLLLLRASAMALLSGFIPFAERSQLQSFFATSNSIVPGIGLHVCPTKQPLLLLSLNLLARACFYSLKEDIHLIPESVWGYLESISTCNSGIGNVERKICEALCNLRRDDGDAKEVLNKVFPSNSAFEQTDPDFERTRGSIFEVLATMPSMQSYMDFFSKKIDNEAQELDEAEIEMQLLLKEKASLDSREIPVEEPSFLKSQDHLKDSDRLMKLRNEIRELERSRLRVEVAARRQTKLLAQHARQKYLDEAASREMELLRELDRERINEMEREIERQRLLEIENAKTRELRFNLDLEREKQTQRELQKELEQAESGMQVSRKEFTSSTSSGRTRERYRDRDGGRMGGEGSIRPSSRGRENIQASTSSTQVPTLVLSGSNRSFSGSIPTILQVRDRSDERAVGYEEGLDGSRDSGDTGAVGDQDSISSFDGLPGGYGPGGRHGSRGTKSRQIIERREREGRREGKWERKHS